MGIMKQIQLEEAEREISERWAKLEAEWFEETGEHMDGELIEALEWALEKDD
jgi:hypothetical protein